LKIQLRRTAEDRQRDTPAIRRARFATVLSAAAFIVLLTAGPLSNGELFEQLFGAALILDVALLVAFATRRIAFSLAFASVVFGGLLIAGTLKFHYLTTPLLAPDLVYFLNKDLLDVATRYPSIMIALVGGAILIPGLLVIAWWLDPPRLFVSLGKSTRRIVQTLGIIATLALVLVIDSPQGPFGDVFSKGMWALMNDKNYLVDFFTSFYQTQIHIPPVLTDADKNLVWTQIASDNPPACRDHPCMQDDKLAAPQEHPDIVAILEESTFDPRMLPVCTIPQCKRRMFDPDGHTRAHGPLTVHVWGGGTWTSEFALLTGLNHNTFGEAGLYAPYNLAPLTTTSLPRVLKAAGYRAIAIYPMNGAFINARNAYAFYGFDKFYDGEDYGLSWESPDSDLVQVFDRIYAEEKAKIGKQPLFVMMLTLRQHGPHMTPLEKLPPPYNRPLFAGKFPPKGLDDWLNINLGNYLQRLEGSDAAITHIEKTLLDGPRPTLLFHFGDHQPSFDGAIRSVEKKVPDTVNDPNFVTYFMLKTNYKPARTYKYDAMDLSFAGSLILDIAGVKKDDAFQANALMRDRCGGYYLDCANRPMVDSYHNRLFHDLIVLHE
jgi:phosphoglycerol transferase MdoB-like AlkP superfamily enzyme